MSDFRQESHSAHPRELNHSLAIQRGTWRSQNRSQKPKMARGFSAAWMVLKNLGVEGYENQLFSQTYSEWQSERDQTAAQANDLLPPLSGLDTLSHQEVIQLVTYQANLVGQMVRAEVLSLSVDPHKAYMLIQAELGRGHQVILHTDIHSINANDYYVLTGSIAADSLNVQQDASVQESTQSFQEFSDLLGSAELSKASQLLVFSR